MTTIRIRNWERFQHFKDRDPIWIKLYRELRHKKQWRVLPGDAAKLLVDLWMLASESKIPGDIAVISSCSTDPYQDATGTDLPFELRTTWEDLAPALQVLKSQDFIDFDNDLISACYQDDIPRALAREEKRREEICAISDEEAPEKPGPNKAVAYESEFEEFWEDYPRKIDRKKSLKAYQARRRQGISADELLAGRDRYKAHLRSNGTDPKFIKHAATFLGPNEHWRESYDDDGHDNTVHPSDLAGQW